MDNFNTRILKDTKDLIRFYNTKPDFEERVNAILTINPNIPYKGRPLRFYVEVISKISPRYKKYYQGSKTDPEKIKDLFKKYYLNFKDFHQLDQAIIKGTTLSYSQQDQTEIEKIENIVSGEEKATAHQERFKRIDSAQLFNEQTIPSEITEETEQIQPQLITSAHQFMPNITNFGKNIGADLTSKGSILLKKGIKIGGSAVAKGGAQLLGKGAAALVGLGSGPAGWALLALSSLPKLSKLPSDAIKTGKNTLIITTAVILAVFLLPSLLESQSFFPPFEVAESAPIPTSGPPQTYAASCPVENGTVSYHSYSKGGHCSIDYGYGCPCTPVGQGRRANAIDVPTNGQDVFLPTIENQQVQWQLIEKNYLIDSTEGGGVGNLFQANLGSDVWTVDILHLLPTNLEKYSNTNREYPSGTAIGKASSKADINGTIDDHIHISLGKNIEYPVLINNTPPALFVCSNNWLAADDMCR